MPAATDAAATYAICSGFAPTTCPKSSRHASPSCSQSSHDPRSCQLASVCSTAATVERGGSPYVAVSRYPRVDEPSYSDGASNVLESLRVLHGGKVTGILPQSLRAYRPAHDLRAARLGEGRHEHDAVGLERAP